MGIVLIMNKMRIIRKWTRMRDKQFLCKNMTVLHAVSDQYHVLRFGNPVSLQPMIDFNMKNSKAYPTKKMMKSNLLVNKFPFCEFEKLSYFQGKGGHLIFTFYNFELLIAITF